MKRSEKSGKADRKSNQKLHREPQDFESVARRLECDPDLKKFDDQLRKIARAKTAKR